jgi:hypothetical protein
MGGVKFIRRSDTYGALRREHVRTATFSDFPQQYMTGPGATHAGLNKDLSVRFGVFSQKQAPAAAARWRRFTLFRGEHVAEWLALSDMTYSSVSAGRLGLAWEAAYRGVKFRPNEATNETR